MASNDDSQLGTVTQAIEDVVKVNESPEATNSPPVEEEDEGHVSENATSDAAGDAAHSSNEIVLPKEGLSKEDQTTPTSPQIASPSGSSHRHMQMFGMFTRRLLSPLGDPKNETKVDLEAEKKRQLEMLREQLQQMDAGLVETLDAQQRIQETLVEKARSESQVHGSLPMNESDLFLKQDDIPIPLPIGPASSVSEKTESKQEHGGPESLENQLIASDEVINVSSESVEPESRVQGQEANSVNAIEKDRLRGTESDQDERLQSRIETEPAHLTEPSEDITGDLSTTSIAKEKLLSGDKPTEKVDDSVSTHAEQETLTVAIGRDETLEHVGELSTKEEGQPASDDVPADKVVETLDSAPTTTEPEILIKAIGMKEDPEIASDPPTNEEQLPLSDEIPDNVDETIDTLETITEPEASSTVLPTDENMENETKFLRGEVEQPASDDTPADKVDESIDTKEPGTMTQATDMKENPEIASEHPSSEEPPVSDTIQGDHVDETLESIPTSTESEALATCIDANVKLATSDVQQPASDDVLVDETLQGLPPTEPGMVTQAMDTTENPEIARESLTKEEIPPLSDESTAANKVDVSLDRVPANTEPAASDKVNDAEIESKVTPYEVEQPVSDGVLADNVDKTLDAVQMSTESGTSTQAGAFKEDTNIANKYPAPEEQGPVSDTIRADNADETLESVTTTMELEALAEAGDTLDNPEKVDSLSMGEEELSTFVETVQTAINEDARVDLSAGDEEQPSPDDTPNDNDEAGIDSIPTTVETGPLIQAVTSENPTSEEETPVCDTIPADNVGETLDSVPPNTLPEASDEAIDTQKNPDHVGVEQSTLVSNTDKDKGADLTTEDKEQRSSDDTLTDVEDKSLADVPTSQEPETLIEAMKMNPGIANESLTSEGQPPVPDDVPADNIDATIESVPTNTETETSEKVMDTIEDHGLESRLATCEVQQPASDDVLAHKVDETLDSVPASREPETLNETIAMTEIPDIASEALTNEEQPPVSDETQADTVDITFESVETNTEPEALDKVIDTNENLEVERMVAPEKVQQSASDGIPADNINETLDSVPTSTEPETSTKAIDVNEDELANESPTSEEQRPVSYEIPANNIDETIQSVETNTEPDVFDKVMDTNENLEIEGQQPSSDSVPAVLVDESLGTVQTSTELGTSTQAIDMEESSEIASEHPASEELPHVSDAIQADNVDETLENAKGGNEQTKVAEVLEKDADEDIPAEVPANNNEQPWSEDPLSVTTVEEGLDCGAANAELVPLPGALDTNKNEDVEGVLSSGDEEQAVNDGEAMMKDKVLVNESDQSLPDVNTTIEEDPIQDEPAHSSDKDQAVENTEENMEALSSGEEPVHVTEPSEVNQTTGVGEGVSPIVSDSRTPDLPDVPSDVSTNEVSKEEGNDDGKVQGAPIGESMDAILAHIHPMETLKRLSVLVLHSPNPAHKDSIDIEKMKQAELIRAKLNELNLEELGTELEQQQQTQTQLVQQAMESSMSRLVFDNDDHGEHGGPREKSSTHNRVLGHVTDWLSSSLHHRDDVKSASASRGGKVDTGDLSKGSGHRAKPHGFLSAVGEYLSGSSHHRDVEPHGSTNVGVPSATTSKEAAAEAQSLRDKLKVLLNECDDNQDLREKILELIQSDDQDFAQKSQSLIDDQQKSLIDKIPSPVDLTIPKNTQALREALNKSRASRGDSRQGVNRKQYWSNNETVEPRAAARAARRAPAMAKLQQLDALIEEAQKRTSIGA